MTNQKYIIRISIMTGNFSTKYRYTKMEGERNLEVVVRTKYIV